MTEKYKSVKSNGFGILLLTVSLLILFLSFGVPIISKQTFSLLELIVKVLLAVLIIGLFIWCWTSTYYMIDKEKLVAICGPFKIPVQISDIREIKTNQKTIGGIIKPTLSWDCIVIEYGNYKAISISPQHQDRFINTLTESNNKIKIKYSA
jgi:hypothetical protein